jgi:hypothetical protein
MCILWGDPHVIGFDQMATDKESATSFYSSGDFWLVKSATVHIQARFEPTNYTEGLAATNRIVVGGPFLHGHKIEVGTGDSGVITVDGKPEMGTFPSSFSSELFELRYDDAGVLPDVVPTMNKKRVVHMRLPLGVVVRVFQWKNYLDLWVEMAVQPGQDGVCGNGNGNPGDDTTQAIMARVGFNRVRLEEELLTGRPAISFTHQMAKMMETECTIEQQARGQALCDAQLGVAVPENESRSCMFDFCFGMNVRARSQAKKYA